MEKILLNAPLKISIWNKFHMIGKSCHTNFQTLVHIPQQFPDLYQFGYAIMWSTHLYSINPIFISLFLWKWQFLVSLFIIFWLIFIFNSDVPIISYRLKTSSQLLNLQNWPLSPEKIHFSQNGLFLKLLVRNKPTLQEARRINPESET